MFSQEGSRVQAAFSSLDSCRGLDSPNKGHCKRWKAACMLSGDALGGGGRCLERNPGV